MNHLKKHTLPQFTQYEKDNLIILIIIKKMEFVIFNSNKCLKKNTNSVQSLPENRRGWNTSQFIL